MSDTPRSTRCEIVPNDSVKGMVAYRVPRAQKPIDLWLDSNEGLSPDRAVHRALSDIDAEVVRRYPSKVSLEAKVAERLNVEPEQIIITGGGDDAIDRCCRAVLGPGRELIIATPTFEMIARSARLAHGEVVEVPWFDAEFPADEMISRITDRTSMIAVVSPNNPTGSVATVDAIAEVARRAPRALVLVDLAYIEFADEDVTSRILQLPNTVAIRTFSKAFGLAGLRVGYAIGPRAVIDWLRAAGSPYPVSGVSIELAEESLNVGAERSREYIKEVRTERASLSSILADRELQVLPSQANFILARFDDALAFRDRLADRGISVRAFPDHPVLRDWLRITCPGNPPTFQRLVEAITGSFGGEQE